ncbi:dephospho-CoA kinase [Maribacter chungangensis]|uniref:Dephospho-CoA kinase n=1 Tax=Maribacter chungangensis TaxID=1069117 RepID=A0ABW3B2W8_9FLAO
MMLVGLTGGIGSGKSTVGKLLEDLGVPVYNSDIEAKRLMNTSKVLRRKIVQLLGEEAFVDDTLNRAYIAKKVFNDKALLEKLNGIVHPAVRKHFLRWAKKKDHPYVVQETALLFENGMQDYYDKTVLVTAPKDIRIKRIMERDGSTRQQVLDRMDNQLDDAIKLPLADYVLENIELDKIKGKVQALNIALLEYC